MLSPPADAKSRNGMDPAFTAARELVVDVLAKAAKHSVYGLPHMKLPELKTHVERRLSGKTWDQVKR